VTCPRTLAGNAAATAAGIRVRINMVALKGLNDDAIESMLLSCAAQGHDLTLIETMPLTDVRARLEERYTLTPSPHGRVAPPAISM